MTLIPAYGGNPSLPSDLARSGFGNYNDFGTIASPISVTGGGGDFVLTNDAAGAQTLTSFLPDGVTSLWNDGTDFFDWSELSIGDTVDIRLDASIETASVNTTVTVCLHLGTGGGVYTIPFISGQDYKAVDTYGAVAFSSIYIGDSNTRDNGAQFKIFSDKTCDVTVNGWYVRVLNRGVL